VVRSRAEIHSAVQPRIVPMPDDDDDDEACDSDDSDRKSKMSFSYWGADKVTLQKPMAKHRPGPLLPGSRRGPSIPSGYSRESSANAKFGSRLVSADASLAAAVRSGGRRTTTPHRRPTPSDEGHSVKVTVTRPAWDGSTRTPATSAHSMKRSRNTSQNSAATRTTTTPSNKVLASPAPSEDSGVGLYRQMIATDNINE